MAPCFTVEEKVILSETLSSGEGRNITPIELDHFISSLQERDEEDEEFYRVFISLILEGKIAARWNEEKNDFEYRLRDTNN